MFSFWRQWGVCRDKTKWDQSDRWDTMLHRSKTAPFWASSATSIAPAQTNPFLKLFACYWRRLLNRWVAQNENVFEPHLLPPFLKPFAKPFGCHWNRFGTARSSPMRLSLKHTGCQPNPFWSLSVADETVLEKNGWQWNRFWHHSVAIEIVFETVRLTLQSFSKPFGRHWNHFGNRSVTDETDCETVWLPTQPILEPFGCAIETVLETVRSLTKPFLKPCGCQ